MKIIEKEYNAITKEEIIVERDETREEEKFRLAEEKRIAELTSKLKENEIAKAKLLEKLGITEDEAKLLLS